MDANGVGKQMQPLNVNKSASKMLQQAPQALGLNRAQNLTYRDLAIKLVRYSFTPSCRSVEMTLKNATLTAARAICSTWPKCRWWAWPFIITYPIKALERIGCFFKHWRINIIPGNMILKNIFISLLVYFHYYSWIASFSINYEHKHREVEECRVNISDCGVTVLNQILISRQDTTIARHECWSANYGQS